MNDRLDSPKAVSLIRRLDLFILLSVTADIGSLLLIIRIILSYLVRVITKWVLIILCRPVCTFVLIYEGFGTNFCHVKRSFQIL